MKADLEQCRLYLLLTKKLCSKDPLDTLARALDGGVDLVQLREKPLLAEDRAWTEQVGTLCRQRQVPLFINDSLELAGVDASFGLHLGQEDLAAHGERTLAQREFSLGISTHSIPDLERALLEEPDYVGLGPCFPTTTKGYQHALPTDVLREVLAASPVPVFGIGGITAQRIDSLLEAGLRRFAVSTAILSADDPCARSAELRKRIEQAPF